MAATGGSADRVGHGVSAGRDHVVRLASYRVGEVESFGLVRDGRIVDLAGRTGCGSIAELLSRGNTATLERWTHDAPDHSLDDVTFLPVIPRPRHVICVGTNYASHVAEVAKAGVARTIPKHPSVFLRTVDSLTGHGQPIIRPRVSEALDFEGELAVIIGCPGRYVAEADALTVVAGYACFNDASVRDWQFHTNNITPGKNFPATGPLGPSLVTRDEVPDPQRLEIRTRLNGQTVQAGNTADMIFSVAQIISYASNFIALTPGDVIATGTPDGVGFSRQPPLFMRPGDVCEIEIEKVGFLRNPVGADAG